MHPSRRLDPVVLLYHKVLSIKITYLYELRTYGVKFDYDGGPGYNGDLYILRGYAMGEPMTLIRKVGKLVLA